MWGWQRRGEVTREWTVASDGAWEGRVEGGNNDLGAPGVPTNHTGPSPHYIAIINRVVTRPPFGGMINSDE